MSCGEHIKPEGPQMMSAEEAMRSVIRIYRPKCWGECYDILNSIRQHAPRLQDKPEPMDRTRVRILWNLIAAREV